MHFYYGLHNYSANSLPERLLEKRYLRRTFLTSCVSEHHLITWRGLLFYLYHSSPAMGMGLDLFGWLDAFQFFFYLSILFFLNLQIFLLYTFALKMHPTLFWHKECLWEISSFLDSSCSPHGWFPLTQIVCQKAQPAGRKRQHSWVTKSPDLDLIV